MSLKPLAGCTGLSTSVNTFTKLCSAIVHTLRAYHLEIILCYTTHAAKAAVFSWNQCVINLTEVKELEGLGAPVTATKVFVTGGGFHSVSSSRLRRTPLIVVLMWHLAVSDAFWWGSEFTLCLTCPDEQGVCVCVWDTLCDKFIRPILASVSAVSMCTFTPAAHIED